MEASKASILVMWTGDFMHSIVRRMRCEVNSAAALLASVDLPRRLWAPLLIDFGSSWWMMYSRGAGEWEIATP